MNIGIIANTTKPEAGPIIQQITRLLDGRSQLYTCIPENATGPIRLLDEKEFFATVELVFSLGGDGTMLHAVQLMGEADVPLMGINLGSLGFMTSVSRDQVDRAVELTLSGEYVTTPRTCLRAHLSDPTGHQAVYTGLNDVTLGWGRSPRIVSLRMHVDGNYVTTYTCDGLIVSTPTGSTGHSLSAGGPILHPSANVLVISPICPHTLSSRPLVVSDDSELRIDLTDGSKSLLLAVDGQEYCCLEGDASLQIGKREKRVRFAHLPDYNYYAILRRKLGWQGSSVQTTHP